MRGLRGERLYKTNALRALDDAAARFSRALVLSVALFVILVLMFRAEVSWSLIFFGAAAAIVVGWLLAQVLATYSAMCHAIQALMSIDGGDSLFDLSRMIAFIVVLILSVVAFIVGLQSANELESILNPVGSSP